MTDFKLFDPIMKTIAMLLGKQVLFFRTQIEPGITAMPKNAIHRKDVKEILWTPWGLYVTNPKGREFFVYSANIQMTEFVTEANRGAE